MAQTRVGRIQVLLKALDKQESDLNFGLGLFLERFHVALG